MPSTKAARKPAARIAPALVAACDPRHEAVARRYIAALAADTEALPGGRYARASMAMSRAVEAAGGLIIAAGWIFLNLPTDEWGHKNQLWGPRPPALADA